ncbi:MULTISPECIES: RNA polymerase factor sigma-54 [Campylobacter]|uniref:RNA polymerase sigma54 factor n=1 Tax=Campylobacter subantarcticus LMG 24374 TaxID=1388751 RepID=A0A0A8HAE4_9BACT|nr:MULTISPECIES: RNA polymerase factor sigma-54 [Campylobacter]AJC90645.1 RNA polymerase sigma54 factor [Campylobacter subantarcticus LMG 24374]EAJ1260722.1 RNA polymerase factor sigma-54 [Campylobacter lari]QOR01914.1 RNA polymerase factor sigma-54 [Campylobacter sp. 2014D-0216]RKO65309.1 RNA polymerase sigma-54 factor [Campylobacter sp. P255]
MLKQKTSITQKAKLSQTLRSWLPILQANIEDLKESLDEFAKENPFIEVKENSSITNNQNKYFQEYFSKNTTTQMIDAKSLEVKNVYELLNEQIIPPFFPTQKSQTIAEKIIECLNHEGYFEYDEEILGEFDPTEVEKIRQRFKYLDPIGVGAKDQQEALIFALEHFDLDDELYEFCKMLILNLENAKDFIKDPLYKQAIAVIKKISFPPFLEYFEESMEIIPDIFIYQENGEIKIKINDDYYPEIAFEADGLDHEFLSAYLKDAKNLIDALAMRKATLYKLGLMIIEYQYDFFMGGDIKPMQLKDLAQDLERNASTISRAIANKYLSCDRGLIPLKSFFTTAVDDGETSNATIKDFLSNLIKKENPKKPLSDLKILELTQKEFPSVQLGRRTITKYRMQLGIGSSSERKKLYELM